MKQESLFQFGIQDDWLDEQACCDLIGPLLGDLCLAVEDGFKDWHKESTERLRSRVQPKDRGQCVTSLIWEAAKDRLAKQIEEGDVKFCLYLGIRKFIIHNRIALRFKTAGSDLTVVPTRTRQDRAWYSNEPIDDFPMNLTRVNIAFRSMPGEDAVQDIHFTWQASPKSIGWCRLLSGRDIGTVDISESPLHQRRGTPTKIDIIPRVEKRKKGEETG